MSRLTDLSAVMVVSYRHCNRFDCPKCRARSRWARRKSWRAGKSPNRTIRDRKR